MSNIPKIVFSFDFELGWGVLDEPALWKQRESESLYTSLRPVIDSLVTSLHETRIPTTWALVSSLLASTESDINVDHLPSSYKDDVISFWRESKEKTRCGLDIVDKLKPIDSLIEFASHTSTHIYAEHDDVTSVQYLADVSDSILVIENYFGRSVRSLIFPRDQAKFNNDIAQQYPLNFRLNPNFGRSLGKLSRIVEGASRVYKMAPNSKIVMGAYGEYYQTGSLYFNWSGGSYESIKKYLTKLQANRLIGGIQESSVYHVWLHPFNLAESREHLEEFTKFIVNVAKLRDAGLVDVVTMNELTKECKKEFTLND